MINVCIAESIPMIQYAIRTYFSNHSQIKITSILDNFEELISNMSNNNFNVLVVDLSIENFESIKKLKKLAKEYTQTNIIILTALSEKMYAPIAMKIGISAFLSKKITLQELERAIIKVYDGYVIYSENIKKNLSNFKALSLTDGFYKKLSNRELEVLRFLSEGKKNKEISNLLFIDEKTVSTYKLRLQSKLHVNNLIDLINKAKQLDII